MKALKSGCTAPEPDARLESRVTDHPQQDHADAWLNWCWNTLAVPMPNGKVKDYYATLDDVTPEHNTSFVLLAGALQLRALEVA